MCERTPRADCSEMIAFSTIMQMPKPQPSHARERGHAVCSPASRRPSACSINAIVSRKISVERSNFSGLIHGFRPRMRRVSNGIAASAPTVNAT